MSYRLIDANALATSCAEVNDLPCIYADLPNGLDGGHYAMTGSGMTERKNGLKLSRTEYIGWLDEDHAPVVDMAQEVVRCRDCKHFFPHFTRNDPETPHYCELHGSDWVWPDSYCSGGERKDA